MSVLYPNLSRAIEHVVDTHGPIEGRTRIIKLVFLSDREWWTTHKRVYTEAHYYRWNHGPFAKEILSSLESMDGIEVIERRIPFDGGATYAYSKGNQSRLSRVQLDATFLEILNRTAKAWSNRPLKQLLDHVYGLADFKNVEFGGELLVAR